MPQTPTTVLRSRAARPLACTVSVLVLSVLLAGQAEGQSRGKELNDIPGTAAQAEAKRLVEKVYGDLINANSNDDKASAARLLIIRAAETDDAPAAKYIMYQTARSLAVEAGDTRMAMDAIDGLTESFLDHSGSLIEMASTTLQDLSRRVRSDSDHAAVAQAGLAVAERLIAADRYDDAFTLLTRLKSSALRSKRPELASAYKEMPKELRIISVEAERISDDLAQFQQNPEDPKLSLSAGKFLALYRGDWEAGLTALARSSDEALAGAAKADLAGASEPKAQRAIGDRWWELASAGSWMEKRSLEERAKHWYRMALPTTFGIERSLLTKRLSPMGQVKWGDLVLEPGIRTMIEVEGDKAGAKPGPIAREASWDFDKKPPGAKKGRITMHFKGYLYSRRTAEVGLMIKTRATISTSVRVNGRNVVSSNAISEVPVQLIKGYNAISGSVVVPVVHIDDPDLLPIANLNLTDLNGKEIAIPAEQWFHDVTR